MRKIVHGREYKYLQEPSGHFSLTTGFYLRRPRTRHRRRTAGSKPDSSNMRYDAERCFAPASARDWADVRVRGRPNDTLSSHGPVDKLSGRLTRHARPLTRRWAPRKEALNRGFERGVVSGSGGSLLCW